MNTKVELTREQVEAKYINARRNLLLMMVFTFINIVVLAIGSETMLLFSATMPYMASVFSLEFGGGILLSLIVGVVFIVPYLLCWIFSKKRWGWMLVALILFVLDTLAMLGMYALFGGIENGIFDLVIHIWVLYYLIVGVKQGSKLKKMPVETEMEEPVFDATYNEVADTENIQE